MFHFITRSLKIKFALIIACVLLIVFTCASLFLITQSINSLTESLVARAETYSQLATKPLGDAYNLYHNGGIFQLNNIFGNTLKVNNTIPRIQVISVGGQVLYDTNNLESNLPSVNNTTQESIIDPKLLQIIDGNTQTDIKDSHNNVMEIISPYSDQYGNRPYSLRYFLSYDSINASVMQAIRTTVFLNILLFVITFISVLFLVNNSLLTPLVKLAIFAKAVGKGDFDFPLEIKSGDELERLAIDYRYMASNLKAQKASITAEKDTLSLVLSNIGEGIAALDSSFAILVLNSAAAKLFNVKKEDCIDKQFDELIKLAENGAPVSITNLCKQSENKPSYFSLDFLTEVGESRKINVIIAPLMHPAESNIRFIITFYDLTKEQEFEKMKLDFVSMSAHELRTPLTSIRGYLSLLQKSVVSKLSGDESTYLQRSIISSEGLSVLIENLLNISNIEKGKMNIYLDSFDLEKTISSVITTFQANAQEVKVQLEFDKPEHPLPNVMADELRIKEVLTNLITNAINFNRPGGWVKVTMQLKENHIIVAIKDNGVGIAESSLPHLFTKFYRVTTPLIMGSKGTGLGLFISKKILDAHKEKIWVESKLDKETVFSFTLALAEKKS